MKIISGFYLFLCFFIVENEGRKCGKLMSRPSPGKLQGKIVGGYQVGYYKYPWYAALQIDDDTFCGAALIGNGVVLTAAHCYDAAKSDLENYYMVKVGLHNQCKNDSIQKTYKPKRVVIHEKYKDNKPYYDIALILLDGDTSPYMPICLPSKELTDKDFEPEGWIAGFGTTISGNDNSYPCEMREGRILMYDNVTCRAMVKKESEDGKYARYINAICAGYKAGGVDTCQGDSGGPLMTFDSITNLWQTVGVTSYGWGCGDKNRMGVYTDVSKYLEWIEDNSNVSPSDYEQTVTTQNTDENDEADSNQSNDDSNQNTNSNSNDFASTIIKIYDHIMNSEHRPTQITIDFKTPHSIAENRTLHRHQTSKKLKLKQKSRQINKKHHRKSKKSQKTETNTENIKKLKSITNEND